MTIYILATNVILTSTTVCNGFVTDTVILIVTLTFIMFIIGGCNDRQVIMSESRNSFLIHLTFREVYTSCQLCHIHLNIYIFFLKKKLLVRNSTNTITLIKALKNNLMRNDRFSELSFVTTFIFFFPNQSSAISRVQWITPVDPPIKPLNHLKLSTQKIDFVN